MATATSYPLPRADRHVGGWIRSPAWDLTFVSLSVVLVLVPYTGFRVLVASGLDDAAAATAVDLIVTLFIGGPHMYATFTRTIADPGFRAARRRIVASSLLIPVGVVVLGFWALPLLLTVFFLWASVHVLHQITFLVECYNRRGPAPPSWTDRAIDYAVVVTSPYPIALFRLVDGTFTVSGVTLVFPEPIRGPWIVWLAGGAFAISLALFTAKTARDIARGTAHYPKILLISLTVVVAFLLPIADRLDAAFQGFNAWHSFQYLGLTWYANRLAAERRRPGEPSGWAVRFPTDGPRFYGALVLCTIGAGVVFGLLSLLRGPLGLTPEQPYYVTVLSFLLVHYYHDHILFTQPEAIVAEPSPA